MTQNQADAIYGPVVYKDDRHLIRAKRQGEQLLVVTHRVQNNTEFTPTGYVPGMNALKTQS